MHINFAFKLTIFTRYSISCGNYMYVISAHWSAMVGDPTPSKSEVVSGGYTEVECHCKESGYHLYSRWRNTVTLFIHTYTLSLLNCICSPGSPTFKGSASLLSVVTACLAGAIQSLPGQYSYCPREVASLYEKYCDASAMAVASLQRGTGCSPR